MSNFEGVAAKIQQYSIESIPDQIIKKYNLNSQKQAFTHTHNVNKINIKELLSVLFKKDITEENVIVINVASEKERFKNTTNELQKISINNFFRLDATYWKNKKGLVEELNYVINFLSTFNTNIQNKNITIDDFSEANDTTIKIQDGPLACYVSHLRAMIHGYNNFHDYTIIVEDDIDIKNINLIEEHLPNIPDDWDIIFFGSCPKTDYGDSVVYKFVGEFHSLHFYMIKNSSFEKIFKILYPITDQVDVLISDNFKKFNYYNIKNAVYQKNLSTNTQNNLYVIYNSPHYGIVRKDITVIKEQILNHLNKILLNNNKNNNVLCLSMLFDVIYAHFGYTAKPNNKYEPMIVNNHAKYIKNNIRLSLFMDALVHFLYCTEKGTNIASRANGMISNIIDVVNNFVLHDKIITVNDFQLQLKAYEYGSTCTVYKSSELNTNESVIVKQYSNYLRWKTDEHDDSEYIFKKELTYLKMLNGNNKFARLIGYNEEEKTLTMTYCGESLFNNFILPENWKIQLRDIFEELNKCNIVYTEFNLKNIVVKNETLKLIDFGLAKNSSVDDPEENNKNCDMFIEMLEILNNKIQKNMDIETKMLLCKIFIDNIKTHKSKFLSCIY